MSDEAEGSRCPAFWLIIHYSSLLTAFMFWLIPHHLSLITALKTLPINFAAVILRHRGDKLDPAGVLIHS